MYNDLIFFLRLYQSVVFKPDKKLKLRGAELNVPEELVFSHIAALFGTLSSSVWLRQRRTTLHEKNKSFRCEAVFGEQIFVETRRKNE